MRYAVVILLLLAIASAIAVYRMRTLDFEYQVSANSYARESALRESGREAVRAKEDSRRKLLEADQDRADQERAAIIERKAHEKLVFAEYQGQQVVEWKARAEQRQAESDKLADEVARKTMEKAAEEEEYRLRAIRERRVDAETRLAGAAAELQEVEELLRAARLRVDDLKKMLVAYRNIRQGAEKAAGIAHDNATSWHRNDGAINLDPNNAWGGKLVQDPNSPEKRKARENLVRSGILEFINQPPDNTRYFLTSDGLRKKEFPPWRLGELPERAGSPKPLYLVVQDNSEQIARERAKRDSASREVYRTAKAMEVISADYIESQHQVYSLQWREASLKAIISACKAELESLKKGN